MEARDFVLDLQKWGLTQAQIAERSGVPQPTISKIARGTVEDVLSRNYRSLQAVHQQEAANKRAGAAGDSAAPGAPTANDSPKPAEAGAS